MPCNFKMDKRQKNKAKDGGTLKGPSHKEGGIPIEAEGGEYIVRKNSVNPDTERVLKYINENGELPNGNTHDYPTINSKNRRKE